MSSGSSTSLIANPTVSRGSSVGSTLPAGRVANTVACGDSTPSVPPDQTIGICLTSCGGPAALGGDHLAERPVGDDPGVVVDAAVALGLADHRDDPVGLEHPGVDQRGQLAGVGHAECSGILRTSIGSGTGVSFSVLLPERCVRTLCTTTVPTARSTRSARMNSATSVTPFPEPVSSTAHRTLIRAIARDVSSLTRKAAENRTGRPSGIVGGHSLTISLLNASAAPICRRAVKIRCVAALVAAEIGAGERTSATRRRRCRSSAPDADVKRTVKATRL